MHANTLNVIVRPERYCTCGEVVMHPRSSEFYSILRYWPPTPVAENRIQQPRILSRPRSRRRRIGQRLERLRGAIGQDDAVAGPLLPRRRCSCVHRAVLQSPLKKWLPWHVRRGSHRALGCSWDADRSTNPPAAVSGLGSPGRFSGGRHWVRRSGPCGRAGRTPPCPPWPLG